ncbi:hypothetical protein Hamer_G020077, partial [Homarus americanus]
MLPVLTRLIFKMNDGESSCGLVSLNSVDLGECCCTRYENYLPVINKDIVLMPGVTSAHFINFE